MREQPRVCFEVDEIDGPSSWRSVVAEGLYEELSDEASRRIALRLLAVDDPVAPGLNGASPTVVFRLRLTEKSGRFERRDA
jgi:nitroimidazol reductase NimA-like FMN-containing flavoprotein (pyridoxamine 5'-phosphate oxidase superfamily)